MYNFSHMTIKHIYREHNQQADCLSKKGLVLDPGFGFSRSIWMVWSLIMGIFSYIRAWFQDSVPSSFFWHMILYFLSDGLKQVSLTRHLAFSLCSGWIILSVITALKGWNNLSGWRITFLLLICRSVCMRFLVFFFCSQSKVDGCTCII